MKATGIVRRICDLGRVVIPKEIRRTLRVREGPVADDIGIAAGILLRDAEPFGKFCRKTGKESTTMQTDEMRTKSAALNS